MREETLAFTAALGARRCESSFLPVHHSAMDEQLGDKDTGSWRHGEGNNFPSRLRT